MDEHTVDLLEPGQAVCWCFDRSPNWIQNGSLGQVLVGEYEASPVGRARGESVRGAADEAAKRYLVSVETDSLPAELSVFSGGRARVKISSVTLLARLNQQLQHTFQYR